jgi:hypothetical protein
MKADCCRWLYDTSCPRPVNLLARRVFLVGPISAANGTQQSCPQKGPDFRSDVGPASARGFTSTQVGRRKPPVSDRRRQKLVSVCLPNQVDSCGRGVGPKRARSGRASGDVPDNESLAFQCREHQPGKLQLVLDPEFLCDFSPVVIEDAKNYFKGAAQHREYMRRVAGAKAEKAALNPKNPGCNGPPRLNSPSPRVLPRQPSEIRIELEKEADNGRSGRQKSRENQEKTSRLLDNADPVKVRSVPIGD